MLSITSAVKTVLNRILACNTYWLEKVFHCRDFPTLQVARIGALDMKM